MGHFFDMFGTFDECSIDRFTEKIENQSFWDSKRVSTGLFVITQVALFLIFVQLLVRSFSLTVLFSCCDPFSGGEQRIRELGAGFHGQLHHRVVFWRDF